MSTLVAEKIVMDTVMESTVAKDVLVENAAIQDATVAKATSLGDSTMDHVTTDNAQPKCDVEVSATKTAVDNVGNSTVGGTIKPANSHITSFYGMKDTVNKPSAAKWTTFADKMAGLHLDDGGATTAEGGSASYGGTSDGNDNGTATFDADWIAAQEYITGISLRPMHFYRSDGKLFHRQWDLSLSSTKDPDWEENEVYFNSLNAEKFGKDGYLKRPTYTTGLDQPRPEVNLSRWKLTPVPENFDYEYERRNTWKIEALLNNFDFNLPDKDNVTLRPLNNRVGQPLENLYPKGYQLLLKESRRGGPEWQPGQPIGPDPKSQEAATTHIGWVPKRQRQRRRGLGADPTDAVQKDWFFGDLDVPVPKGFREPRETWSKNPLRTMTMKSTVTRTNPTSHEFTILSKEALKKKHFVAPKDRLAPENREPAKTEVRASFPWMMITFTESTKHTQVRRIPTGAILRNASCNTRLLRPTYGKVAE